MARYLTSNSIEANLPRHNGDVKFGAADLTFGIGYSLVGDSEGLSSWESST